MTTEIKKINKDNINNSINEIAKIHKSAYSKNHFTSTFNHEILKKYYLEIINKSDITLIAKINSDVVGFLVGGEDFSTGINNFIINNKIYIFTKALISPNFIFNYVKKVINPLPACSNGTNYRVLSIAVCREKNSQGIGGKLINELESILKIKRVSKYGLSVKKDNFKAIRFYEKNKFTKESENSSSIRYFKNI